MKKLTLFLLAFLLMGSSSIKAQPVPPCYSIPQAPGANPYKTVVDASQNTYILGTFTGTVDLDPSPALATFTSKGSTDLYLAKYSNNGVYLWGLQLGDSFTEILVDLAVDGQGNVFVTSAFQGTVDFNPSPAIVSLTQTGTGLAYFLAKYNANGTLPVCIYTWLFYKCYCC
jgi:hypothetical protein